MNLQGQVTGKPTPLTEPSPEGMGPMADYVMLVAVLVLAMLLLLLFWRQDARQMPLVLPKELVLASLMRRTAAGLLDLVPAAVVTLLLYHINLKELGYRWPGMGEAGTWSEIAPGLCTIAIFVAHTLLTELVFARSLGKMLMGLRVTTLNGERPRLWQLLVRNLLKSFDLLAPLLLVLIALGPYRQRLGDLVARTVVVEPTPPEEEEAEQ